MRPGIGRFSCRRTNAAFDQTAPRYCPNSEAVDRVFHDAGRGGHADPGGAVHRGPELIQAVVLVDQGERLAESRRGGKLGDSEALGE